MARDIIGSIEGEYRRYETLGAAAIAQCPEEHLGTASGNANSLGTLAWHVSGNLKSRFTDFLSADGEKPWRERESEFAPRVGISRADLEAKWADGWGVLWATLASLTDADLMSEVTIRGVGLTVHAALHRSLAHAASHVGQMQYIAKAYAGDDWQWLSIPPGASDSYNTNPTMEKPPG